MVQSLRLHRIPRSQIRHVPIYLTMRRRCCLPPALRRRHCAHDIHSRPSTTYNRRPPAGVRDEGPGAPSPLPQYHRRTTPQDLFLCQRQYTIDILEWVGMYDCKPYFTPSDTQVKLSEDDGPPVANATSSRSLTGALRYLTFSRPDIA
jgi:hypothetical protein